MAKRFVWRDEYCIGIDEIDAQHKTLFAIAHAFEQADQGDDLKRLLMRVYRYTREHFTLEELYMRKCQFPEYQQHCKQHDELLSRFNRLVARFEDTPQKRAQLIDFLAQWIANHIDVDDRRLGEHVTQQGG